ncbi:cupin domain-containing protein [Microbacterium sp. P02]|uniref:cupin domain-containing protein n=1 Tax=Microbacterium sp. P02 TaxID=3366260 RepID=UPI00366C90F4
MTILPTVPLFPGGVAVSDLAVYDWEAVDGRCGGSPHLHTVSSEGYVVRSGSGAVHTITPAGIRVDRLHPGVVLWFSPGTVHRLVNDGDLRLLVVMQNAGLPEAGDAVLTFPSAVLDDPDAYARAAALPADGEDDARGTAARRRRDLAMEGYLELHAATLEHGSAPLAELHARAARLVQSRTAEWRSLWESTVAAETNRTRRQLDALSQGLPGTLGDAAVAHAEQSVGERGFGMCGRLRTWNHPEAAHPGTAHDGTSHQDPTGDDPARQDPARSTPTPS